MDRVGMAKNREICNFECVQLHYCPHKVFDCPYVCKNCEHFEDSYCKYYDVPTHPGEVQILCPHNTHTQS